MRLRFCTFLSLLTALSVLLVAIATSALAQPPSVIDSLERVAPGLTGEKKAEVLYRLLSFYQRSDVSKAIQYHRALQPFLTDEGPRGRTYARLGQGMMASVRARLDSAEYWFELARQSSLQARDSLLTATACSSLGRTLISGGKAEQAVARLLEGLRMTRDGLDEQSIRLRINLTWAYLEIGRYRDGIRLGRHTLSTMTTDQQWMAIYLYNNIAICYGAENMLDSARYFVNKGIQAAEANRDNSSLANGHFILGTIYSNAGRTDLAIREYELALPYREKVGDPLFIVSDLYTLSSLYHKNGQYRKGVETGLQALTLAEKHQLSLKLEGTYHVLALNYEGLRDFERASQYYQKWAVAKDSVYRRANAQAIADMETRYQTEQKEQQIALQKAVITAQDASIQRDYFLIGGLFVLLLLIVALLMLVRSRALRRQQELQHALQEAWMRASLQSQEEERKRVAQDLHDGLGQMISALHFAVGQTSSGADVSSASEKARQMLNEMHREIRNIAYNMMPQVLIREGLPSALKEMSARLTESGQVRCTVSTFEFDTRLPEVQEISLYRTAQEWINNVMKHASATAIEIQLIGHVDELSMTIEDNGDGFDPAALETGSGHGWKNIQSRVRLLRGSVEVDSRPGIKGSMLSIVMPLEAAAINP